MRSQTEDRWNTSGGPWLTKKLFSKLQNLNYLQEKIFEIFQQKIWQKYGNGILEQEKILSFEWNFSVELYVDGVFRFSYSA